MSAVEVSHNLLGAIGGVPRPESDVVVDARDVNKWFGRLHVLKDVCLQVKRQETVVIIGPSGSGKTTFIRCVNHLEKIQSGRIFVNGHLIGYREAGRYEGSLRTRRRTSPISARRSAWSSSASTCSRT
jgi:polar amino acid transport system ATP-binding protein